MNPYPDVNGNGNSRTFSAKSTGIGNGIGNDGTSSDAETHGARNDQQALNLGEGSEIDTPTVVEMTNRKHKRASAARRPDLIGAYRLGRQLGEGGMGTVFEAVHTSLDKTVAIKLISAGKEADQTQIGQFKRELKALGRLSHSNIVEAYDGGFADGEYYLAMELIDGPSAGQILSRAMKESKFLSIGIAAEIVRQAALGLHHAHEQGIIHRDIKPSNLIVDRTGEVKLLDLGLAAFESSVQDRVDASKEFAAEKPSSSAIGTIGYMSPEQAAQGTAIGRQSDLYSLGVTLYKLLTGRLPIEASGTGNAAQMFVAVQNETPVDPTVYRPEIPDGVLELIDRLLQKDPLARPKTADEVATALKDFAADDLAAAVEALQEDDTAASAGERTAVPVNLPTSVPGTQNCSRWTRNSLTWGGLVISLTTALFANWIGRSLNATSSKAFALVASEQNAIEEAELNAAEMLRSGEWEFRVTGKLPSPINTEFYENSADLSSDGLVLVCSSSARQDESMGRADLWVFQRDAIDQPWSSGTNLGPHINSEHDEVLPSLFDDGNAIAFTFSDGETKTAMVIRRESRQSAWSEPTPLLQCTDYQPSVDLTSDGLNAVVSRSVTSWDLFVIRRKNLDSPWGEPIQLGTSINTYLGEVSGSISDDGRLLVFSRLNTNPDLWVAIRDSWDDEFLYVRRLSDVCNCPGFEKHPRLSPDGKTLYFSAIRDDDPIHDIYVASLVRK
ncbi:hypothetical protein CGZ80_16860 [Rhodopirellula sp. MGV]|nr:hypothetical protein CGZ80_16860 [Rhodopirellula sp. MGV]PNY37286.1 serine/threonine protein kinase [Rhodopirellula baltica]